MFEIQNLEFDHLNKFTFDQNYNFACLAKEIKSVFFLLFLNLNDKLKKKL